MEFRYYQDEAIASAFDYLGAKPEGNPLIAMPTGTGKSLVIGGFIWRAMQWFPGVRIVKLTHVQELIEQNFEKLLALWPSAPAGIYSAGLNRRDVAPITYASIQTVAKLYEQFGFVNIVIIDEAHLVSDNDASMYRTFIDGLRKRNPQLRVLGLSATCWRLGMGQLTDGSLFNDVCYDITGRDSFNRLISEGFLAPLIPKQTRTQIDVSGVHVRGGEFVQSELQELLGNERVTYHALKELVEQSEGRHSWLVFTAGIANSEMVAEMLRDTFGVSALAVHSKITRDERKVAINEFKSGAVTCLVNNNVLTTGFDHPGIDLIGVLRPTQSSILWVQMLGRGTRPVYAPGYAVASIEERLNAIAAGPKQNCLVLDFAANTERLGPINDPVTPKKRKAGKPGAIAHAPIKTCEACQTYNHASVRFCTSCGFEFHQSIRYGAHASEKPLIAPTTSVQERDAPVYENFKVDRVTYRIHKGKDKPDSLKISYYSGLRTFWEWKCFEPDHKPYARHVAHDWWKQRFQYTEQFPVAWVPASTEQANQYAPWLRTPSHIRCWMNNPKTKEPQVLAYDFTGNGTFPGTD